MSEANKDWSVEDALKKVADAAGITVEQLKARLDQLADDPTPEDKAALDQLQKTMDGAFKHMDRAFEQMDKAFDTMDEAFDEMDEAFDTAPRGSFIKINKWWRIFK